MEDKKDSELWTVAKKRAMFKKHLYTYVGVIVFLWIIWFLTEGKDQGFFSHGILPWPVWVTFGWGLGLYFNYRDAYGVNDLSAEKEYEKLRKEKENNDSIS
jgi:hypothetical protein